MKLFINTRNIQPPYTVNNIELCKEGVKIGTVVDFKKISNKKGTNLFIQLSKPEPALSQYEISSTDDLSDPMTNKNKNFLDIEKYGDSFSLKEIENFSTCPKYIRGVPVDVWKRLTLEKISVNKSIKMWLCVAVLIDYNEKIINFLPNIEADSRKPYVITFSEAEKGPFIFMNTPQEMPASVKNKCLNLPSTVLISHSTELNFDVAITSLLKTNTALDDKILIYDEQTNLYFNSSRDCTKYLNNIPDFTIDLKSLYKTLGFLDSESFVVSLFSESYMHTPIVGLDMGFSERLIELHAIPLNNISANDLSQNSSLILSMLKSGWKLDIDGWHK